VFARRAIAHALAQPALARSPPAPGELARLGELPAPPVGDATTRQALWRDAGIERTADGLQRLLASPHPLVRAIARCALTRAESRGAHQRLDHPQRDPALDGRHVVVRGRAGGEDEGEGEDALGGERQIAWQDWR
jgi:L-aspartate oxidase